MEWVLFGLAFLYLLLLLRVFPELLVPRCPFCGAHLERKITSKSVKVWHRWHVGWRRFSCVQCLYYHERPFVYREIDEMSYRPQQIRGG
jgi:hypothetical protein